MINALEKISGVPPYSEAMSILTSATFVRSITMEICLNIFFTDTWDQRCKMTDTNAFFDRIQGQIDAKTLFDSNETHCN